MKKHILLISIYFGKLPWYVDYFLHTCKYNPDINFLLVTDDKSFDRSGFKNVSVLNISFNDLILFFKNKLKIEVAIDRPYKICDFRPAFGVIFSDFINGYDFWGYADVDMIFGNIRGFISDDMLDTYDIITPRYDYLAGYFTIFKNTTITKELFMQSKDYVKVFTSLEHCCFDETNFRYQEFANGWHYSRAVSEIESLTHVVKRFEEKGLVNVYYDHHVIDGVPGKIKWNKGILTYNNQFEVLLYHLIRFKVINPPQKKNRNISDVFRVSTTRFY